MRTSMILAFTLALAAAAHGGDAPKAATAGQGAGAAFARIKSLAGTWQAATAMGKVRITYELTAGGSAVLSREEVENMPPMTTVYHLDGSRLLLTHYCMVGNQPRMEARTFDPGANEIRFQFLDATGLASAGAGHMHNATFRFLDENRYESEWQFYEDQHLKMTEKAVYTRVK